MKWVYHFIIIWNLGQQLRNRRRSLVLDLVAVVFGEVEFFGQFGRASYENHLCEIN